MAMTGQDATKCFLIKEYDRNERKDIPVDVRVVTLEGLLVELDEARRDDKKKIAVYMIGKCLLDWT